MSIIQPTSANTFETPVDKVTLSGLASDNVGIFRVTWLNNRGGNGVASDTTSWSVQDIVLSEGDNIITITASDSVGNSATVTLTVTFDPQNPVIDIHIPTNADTYETDADKVTLSGDAWDNIGLARVTWSNDRGGEGEASGTDEWSAQDIGLADGENIITVTAYDSVGNTASETLIVTCMPINAIKWYLNNVKFTDGGTVSGWFIFDADAQKIWSWEFSVSGGEESTFPSFTFDSTVEGSRAFLPSDDNQEFTFLAPPEAMTQILLLSPSPLPNTARIIPVQGYGTQYFWYSYRSIKSGTLIGVNMDSSPPYGYGLLWELYNVSDTEKETLKGWFIYEPDSGDILDWDISYSGTSTNPSSYNSSESGHTASYNSNEKKVVFNNTTVLKLVDHPYEIGDSIPFEEGGYIGDGNYFANRAIISGGITSVPVAIPPEDAAAVGEAVKDYVVYQDPVILTTGAYTYSKILIRGPGERMPFIFAMYYNSSEALTAPLGRKWNHSYNWTLETFDGGNEVKVKKGDGSAEYFIMKADGDYKSKYRGVYNTLELDGSGNFMYRTKKDIAFSFDDNGRLQAITDSNGNTMDFAYSGGCLISVTDPRGTTAVFFYDDSDRITSVDYGGLRQVSFTYDQAGDLTSCTEPGGSTTTFVYDADAKMLEAVGADGIPFVSNTYMNGKVVSQRDGKNAESFIDYQYPAVYVTDRLNRTQEKVFGQLYHLVSSKDANGEKWSYTYDENYNINSAPGPTGLVFKRTYDTAGNILKDTNALGHTAAFTYDAANKLFSVTDPLGYETRFEYDAAGNLITVTEPTGRSRNFGYNTAGLMTHAADRNGNTRTYSYTASGDLDSVIDALGGSFEYTYNELGQMTSLTDPKGNTSHFEYDAGGRLIFYTNALGEPTVYTYDAMNRLESQTAPGGSIFSYTRNAMGDVTAITDPLGNERHYEYNEEDSLIARVDALGRRTMYKYNALDLLNRTTDASGGVTSSDYDSMGNMITLTDPNGHTTLFAYDLVGQLVEETNPLGDKTNFSYNAAGNLLAIRNGRGQTIFCEYDVLGRLVGIRLPDHSITYVLNSEGYPVESIGRDSRTVSTYDALNRLTSRSDEFGNTVQYEYDAAGNVINLIYTDGKEVTYSYDALNRITSVTDWAGRVTTYSYDAASNLSGADLPDGSSIALNFNGSGELTGLDDVSADGDTIFRAQYTMNQIGLTVREDVGLPLEAPLTDVARQFGYNEANQLVMMNGHSFLHDMDGNMVSGTINGGQTTFGYDALNRLIQAGANSYSYDAEGYRVQAVVNGSEIRYVWATNTDLPLVLEEHDGLGNITARYVYGALGLINRESADGEVSVYHFDARGNTVALTDLDGQITDRYAYGPYGQILAQEGDSSNPFTYNGRDGVYDDGSGLYFMRLRYYCPSLMRFVQADKVYPGSLSRPSSLNLYAFVEGNPIDAIDPSGDRRVRIKKFKLHKNKKATGEKWEDGLEDARDSIVDIYFNDDKEKMIMIVETLLPELTPAIEVAQDINRVLTIVSPDPISIAMGTINIIDAVFHAEESMDAWADEFKENMDALNAATIEAINKFKFQLNLITGEGFETNFDLSDLAMKRAQTKK